MVTTNLFKKKGDYFYFKHIIFWQKMLVSINVYWFKGICKLKLICSGSEWQFFTYSKNELSLEEVSYTENIGLFRKFKEIKTKWIWGGGILNR